MRGAEVVTFELPFGQEALWYPDWNIVAVAPHLDRAGVERALARLQAQWLEATTRAAEPAA